MKKIITIVLLFVLLIMRTATHAQITLGLYNGTPEGRALTLKITSATNYQGQAMAGMFFILRWPTNANGIAVAPANFLGANGFSSVQSDWIQDNSYPFYGVNGGYTYRIVEINAVFTAGAAWNAPTAMNIVSFDMTGGVGQTTIELATDAYAQAMANTRYGGGTYYSDINMNGSATVTVLSPTSVPNVSLPLKLLNFSVQAKNCTTILAWTTADEVNTCCFDVELSGDGFSFHSVGAVAAQGDGPGKSYSYSTPQSDGLAYYRLKMIDRDGRFVFSNIRTVQMNCQSAGMQLSIYPNPVGVGEEINISFKSTRKDAGKLVLINQFGQEVYSRAVQIKVGGNLLKISTGLLSSGIYYVKLTDNNNIPHIRGEKIVKQ